MLALLAIILGVLLSQFLPEKVDPEPVPSIDVLIETLSELSSDGGEAMQVPGTPQNRALEWLANDTFEGYYSDGKFIQRYALATLYFATNGESWSNNSQWLDNEDECGRWFSFVASGLPCDPSTGGVTKLWLEKNNLEGTLPKEIGLLTSLVELVLNQNDLGSTIPSEIGELVSRVFDSLHPREPPLVLFLSDVMFDTFSAGIGDALPERNES